MKRIYIAGPITLGGTASERAVAANIARFQDAATAFRAAGEGDRRMTTEINVPLDRLQPGDTYYGSNEYQIGDELIVCGNEVLYRAKDCPQLTEWLRARESK